MAEYSSIIKLDNTVRMLAEIRTIDDAKQLIDLAEAARYYAQRAELGLEAQNHAAEIKLRAQRRAGEILETMNFPSGRPAEKALPDETLYKPTHEEIGITRKDAHTWQTIAAIPE